MKLSSYVTQFLVDHGIRNVYLVSGGGMMHLLDSVGRQKGLRYVCNHHEQASAIAAESEARLTGRPACVMATTGPGATNALSGVVGAWYDSVPVLVITGQVRVPILADYAKHRQIGPQEVDIGGMARAVTKHFVTVKDPASIRFELERALFLATDGRPGPVWLDLPLDVQSATIDESKLDGFTPPDRSRERREAAERGARDVVERLRASKRPILLAGNGVHLARAEAELIRFVERTRIPVVETIGGMDLVPDDHPQLMGRVGPTGQRRANFALQNADLLLGVGASFSIASIGFNVKEFAVKAKSRILVNVDPAEASKPHFTPDLAVIADAKEWLAAATEIAPASLPSKRWLDACAEWKRRYPPLTPDYYEDRAHANSYVFASVLSGLVGPGEAVVTGNSLDIVSVFAAWNVKAGQRLYTNINYGQMGWDLPGAIGAAGGNGFAKRTILITGDGSIMLNVHELAPIAHGKLPIKIFVLSNGGYQSIRATQQNFFDGLFVGSSADSGVGIPDLEKLAAAFDLPFARIRSNDEIERVAKPFLEAPGPGLCEVVLNPAQERTPRLKSLKRPDGSMESRSLEDMYPYLPREEVHANMHLFDDDP